MGHGTVRYDDEAKKWVITAAPHVLIRLKRVFERISKNEFGAVTLADTPENALELEWFLQRYPLEIQTPQRLFDRANVHRAREAAVAKVLAPAYKAPNVELAVPLREYQRVAVALAHAKGALLVGDDVGLGKSAVAIGLMADPKALPAVVVTLTHLPKQWESEIKRFAPALRTHILKSGKPYDLTLGPRGKKGEFPDVIITNYHKLRGWADVLGEKIKTVIFDEIQELRTGSDADKWKAAKYIADRATLKGGLSIGPESTLELVGGPFKDGWVGSIETAFDVVSQVCPTQRTAFDAIVSVVSLGVRARGWDGAGFAWRSVRSFIRHGCYKPTLNVTAGGRKLLVTEDHSVYVAGNGELTCVRGDALQPTHIVPSDNGKGWLQHGYSERLVDVIAVARTIARAQVVVDLSGVARRDLGLTAWQWQNCHREATYGTRLPVDVFLQNEAVLPAPQSVYVGRGKAAKAPAEVRLSEWAYVLGFFLGDGWVENAGRVAFAVDLPRVAGLVDALNALPLQLRPKIQPCGKKSVEVRCTHKLFAAVLLSVCGKVPCFEKTIPGSWIVSWPEAARRELLRGLLDSDGHQRVGARNRASSRYTTTSRALAHAVAALVRSLGVAAGIHERAPTDGGLVNGRRIRGRRPSYAVYWSTHALDGNTHGQRGSRCDLGWSRELFHEARVRYITEASRPVYVYDLEMEGHPSFTADGLLVHNSATPVYNYGGEIFNILTVLFPDALGSYEEFNREWCGGNVYGGDRSSIKEPKAFGTYLREQGMMLRRTRAEVGRELPDLSKIPYVIEANLEEFDKIESSAINLAKVLLTQGGLEKGAKLRAAEELSWMLRQATGIAKATYVADFVRLLIEQGEKVVLFGWHRAVYEIWRERLKDFEPAFYTGEESPTQKAHARQRFIEGQTPLLVLSLRAGAGLDGLQHVSRTVVFGELDWSPGVHEQCMGRVFRDGQQEKVAAYFLLSNHGSDPVVADVLGVKRMQSDALLDPTAALVDAFTGGVADIKKLAETFLQQRGVPLPQPVSVSPTP